MSRRSVVLPQPEGPSRVKNSLSAMSKLTALRAVNVPEGLGRTSRRAMAEVIAGIPDPTGRREGRCSKAGGRCVITDLPPSETDTPGHTGAAQSRPAIAATSRGGTGAGRPRKTMSLPPSSGSRA